MLTHLLIHSRFLKESLRVLICLSLFNFQGSSFFLSGLTCSYEGFDYEQDSLFLIIFSLLCPVAPDRSEKSLSKQFFTASAYLFPALPFFVRPIILPHLKPLVNTFFKFFQTFLHKKCGGTPPHKKYICFVFLFRQSFGNAEHNYTDNYRRYAGVLCGFQFFFYKYSGEYGRYNTVGRNHRRRKYRL